VCPRSVAFVRPCNPTATSQPPVGERWVHEAKWDGWRFQIIKAAGNVRLFARSGAAWTDRLPAIAEAFAALPARSAQLDGELCLCDERGRPNFHALQGTMRSRYPDQAALSFHAFDLLHLNGADLRPKPLLERRKRLAGLHDAAEIDQFYLPDAFDDGAQLLATCGKLGMEGIVSKRVDRPYVSGPSRDWLKVKCSAWKETNRERWRMFQR
jgi:bifunctional non-homologous end joining protein LigD